jgi:hypothetical protein
MSHTCLAQPSSNGDDSRPEFFPLPQRGPDRYFGLSRSSYYDLEKRGMLMLRRLRKPGNLRGKVLVPYGEVSTLLRTWTGSVKSSVPPKVTIKVHPRPPRSQSLTEGGQES